ncbi:3'(2'),5'-bisphosphate nucleotidase CysQ [Shimia sp. R11_0]|uniref:3'(2'),5'-bisphosphate nucleotidase CysQ n=1 Tax=Shimia sp. R11_0 TaxID=2821096 RepID=UPI001AD9EF7C|nr:3'(2'),5'-bisphosphate nucleotidase CysQ [Shimia sp. R11_0]MBO9478656.1 3'(2'),5'-bisphosphate nucleotidase CysQ [Shimia sp. R11_0]
MPETDLELLIAAAQAAGEIATQYDGKSAKTWHKPNDAGPVTEADLAVNDMLEDRLRKARPEYGWLSEESLDEGDRVHAEKVFIIDPIDGTRSFTEGSDTWAHALAIAERGVVTAAVIYLPRRNKLYSAAQGAGAKLNGVPVGTAARTDMAGAKVLVARPVMDPALWKAQPPAFERGYRPSLAYRTALVAQGRFDAMVTLRPTWEWDVAAGDLILREAGAATLDRNGAPLRFNNADPRLSGMIAANPALAAQITEALAPHPPHHAAR